MSEIHLLGSIALFVSAGAGSALVLRLYSRWARASALARARRIASRLRKPAGTLEEVEDQSAAIEELAQFESTWAVEIVARDLLEDVDPAARTAAVEILRRTRAFDRWIRDLQRGSYPAKLAAIEALGQVGDERAMDELIEALGSDDPGVAAAASRAVVARDPDCASDRLADALSSPNRRVAETAAAVLVRMGNDAVEALVSQLSSLNPQARRLSAECLGAASRPQFSGLLLPMLETDPDAAVRAAAADALARCGGERAFEELRKLTRSDPDWFVRARAYSLLAEMTAPGAAEFLTRSLAELERGDPFGEEEEAVEVVAEGTRRVRAAIIAGLRTLGLTDEEVAAAERAAYREQLEEDPAIVEGDEAASWLETVAALSSHDAGRRAEAARQLGEAGWSAVAALRRALRDPEPLVRQEAACSLGRTGTPDCLEALAACLRDPDPGVRLACSTAMRAIVTREAARELQD